MRFNDFFGQDLWRRIMETYGIMEYFSNFFFFYYFGFFRIWIATSQLNGSTYVFEIGACCKLEQSSRIVLNKIIHNNSSPCCGTRFQNKVRTLPMTLSSLLLTLLLRITRNTRKSGTHNGTWSGVKTFLIRIHKEGILNNSNEFSPSRYFWTNEKLIWIIWGFSFIFRNLSNLGSDESTQRFDTRFRNQAWTLVLLNSWLTLLWQSVK